MHVAHKDDDVRRLDGDLRLCFHFLENDIVCFRFDTTRVDQNDRLAVPFRFIVDSVACNARDIFHDGDARTCDLVKKRALADIRSADDRRNGLCHDICPFLF